MDGPVEQHHSGDAMEGTLEHHHSGIQQAIQIILSV